MIKYSIKTPWNQHDKNVKVFILPYSSIIFEKCKKQLSINSGSACVILYHSAIEAVFNDISGFYECMYKYKPINMDSENNIRFVNFKEGSAEFHVMNSMKKIERQTIDSKVKELIKIRSMFLDWDEDAMINDIKNQKWYKEMSILIKTRNALVHPKAIYQTMDKDTKKITGFNRFMNDHVNKNRISEVEFGDFWIEKLDTPNFCYWCEETAYNAIEGIKGLLIKSDFNDYLLKSLKLMR